MTDKDTSEKQAPSLFSQLVIMFATSALQQMGKLVNPMTGKVEAPNLEGAQATIDMLDMLAEKTRGNLDEQEARMLKDAAASLKMTYVETAQAAPRPEAGPSAAAPAEPPAEPKIETPKGGQADSGGPRFHKKYD